MVTYRDLEFLKNLTNESRQQNANILTDYSMVSPKFVKIVFEPNQYTMNIFA